jgi:hypothetical protein
MSPSWTIAINSSSFGRAVSFPDALVRERAFDLDPVQLGFRTGRRKSNEVRHIPW